MGGAGTAIALLPEPKAKEVTISQVAAVSQPTVEASIGETVPTPVDETVAAQTPVVEPEPEPEQPKFGEDPNTPGSYRVFDKVWIMDQAGIAENDRQYVESVLDARKWLYKMDAPPSRGDINLCDMRPATKMQAFGADYMDNPVTPLKACAAFVVTRYDSWQAASEFFAKSHYL